VKKTNKIECLAPGGSPDKLKLAVNYGADAVYIGGQQYGLRARADNFTLDEMKQGVAYAHARNSKVYVVLNSFLHDKDFSGLSDYLTCLQKIDVDAVIVSDIGVIQFIRDHAPHLDIHLSTQASCLNSDAALFWKQMGVKRLILGREIHYQDAVQIKKNSGLEIEVFIHGSQCMAFSGHCVISNYTQGRDSNRGGCAHSCRFEYELQDLDGMHIKDSYFMNAKDLYAAQLVPKIVHDGVIDSLKIEGRMKSELYLSTTVSAYSKLLSIPWQNKKWESHWLDTLKNCENELQKLTNRGSTVGHLGASEDRESIQKRGQENQSLYGHGGEIIHIAENEYAYFLAKDGVYRGSELEVLSYDGESIHLKADWILDLENNWVDKTKPGEIYKLAYVPHMQKGQVVRWKNALG
jgi:putative protease